LLIKYIKSVLWRAEKCLSYIEEARCLKVNPAHLNPTVLHPTVFLNCWSVAVHLLSKLQCTSRHQHHDVLTAPWRCRYRAAATLRWHLLQRGQFDK